MTRLDKSNTLVIIPAFNEQESIGSVIKEMLMHNFQFVVIDDGSHDQTRINAMNAGARVVSMPFNSGVGSALKCGFKFALHNGFQAVVQCDADGQHSAQYIETLITHSNESMADLVVGNRFGSIQGTMDVSVLRRFAMVLFSKVLYIRTGLTVQDPTSGFRLISRPLLNHFAEEFPAYYLGDTFEALILARQSGYNVSQVSVPFSNREFGVSTSKTLHTLGRIVQLFLNPLFVGKNLFSPKRVNTK
jgi:glycosyltransferase involved in cell wall biosynthesis